MRTKLVTRGALAAAALGIAACATTKEVRRPEVDHAVSGSGLLLDMAPPAPQLVGAYDFDLLEQVSGKACVNYDGPMYWVNVPELDKIGADAFTRRAISAAVLDAIGRLDDADTIVLTRVWADATGEDRICATVAGRAVRLKKAEVPMPRPDAPPADAAAKAVP